MAQSSSYKQVPEVTGPIPEVAEGAGYRVEQVTGEGEVTQTSGRRDQAFLGQPGHPARDQGHLSIDKIYIHIVCPRSSDPF